MPSSPPSETPDTATRRAPKRSQIERTTRAVIDATIEILCEVGYHRMTIDMISTRSGVARSTIYRHWKNVPELTIQAYDSVMGPNPPLPDLGDIRSDLTVLYKRLAKSVSNSTWGKLLPALVEATHNDPAFENLLFQLADRRRNDARTMLQRAKDRGELKDDAKIEWILDSLTGPLYFRHLVTGTSLRERGMIEWMIDNVLSNALVEPSRGT